MTASNSAGSTRFLPGQLVGQRRFRIVGLLGVGGMGEVYRADDLRLGRDRVALKFLPAGRERDARWLRRFREEIRIARSVAHPHVCRVHDLGDHRGLPFLAMELIDGEDLWRLLRRFGRDAAGRPTVPLPPDRSLELAHQLCSGLAAIHDRGILHRDLKPSNVVIDDRGLAKITDFGLAGWVGEILHKDEGTVPYMAPEQLAATDVSERSDLYSLGLVLYELFTGTQAFEGESRQGLRPPIARNPELDPRIDRAIQLCLQAEPERRPASARELAALLPEVAARPADPFPPPETLLVQTPGEALRPGTAWTTLGALVAGLLLAVFLAGGTHLSRFVDPLTAPEVLVDRARATAAGLGYDGRPAHAVHGFSYEPERLAALGRAGSPPGASTAGASSPVTFWLRQGPSPLDPVDRTGFRTYDDPPPRAPGTVGVRLDPRGRLRSFEALAPGPAGEPATTGEPDWAPLLAAAGVSPTAVEPVRPTLAPPVFADHRAAWEGSHPELGGGVRVEVAAHRGMPVSARLLAPEGAVAAAGLARFGRLAGLLSRALLGLGFLVALVGTLCYARRNFRLRRSDRSAALALTVYVLSVRMAVWLLATPHTVGWEELETFWAHLSEATFYGGLAWLLYTALEPLLRRDWPGLMTSWVRLLHGRFGDPRVARDLLYGAACGVGAVVLAQLCLLLPAWISGRPPDPGDLTAVLLVQHSQVDLQLEALRGLPNALAALLHAHMEAMLIAFFGVAGLFLLWCQVRRAWAAIGIAALLLSIQMLGSTTGHAGQGLVAGGLVGALWLTVLLRLGFLPALVSAAVAAMLSSVPLTPDLAAWYAPGSVLALLATVGIGLYGAVHALGDAPVLRERLTAEVEGAHGADTHGADTDLDADGAGTGELPTAAPS